jgi:hypothetical protein
MSASLEYCVLSLVQRSATECGVCACDCEVDKKQAVAHFFFYLSKVQVTGSLS